MNRSSKRQGLSKTLILKGLQCEKALYLSKNPPPLEIPIPPDLEAKFRAGHEVGALAQDLFPGGREVPFDGLTVTQQVEQTQELMVSGEDVIYEASFAFDNVFVKVDILVRDGESWQIHEVKMGTSVKEVNLDDVAIQYYVLMGCGLQISKVFLVHINNSYVRCGDIDVAGLFTSEDITKNALFRQSTLPEAVSGFKKVMMGEEPGIDIGPHCKSPYECDFIPYCWQHIPENSVFDLRGNGVKKFDLYRRGIVRLEDVPLDELNASQRHQVDATLNHLDSVNEPSVRGFLETLWYPMCFLDFETFSTPIPLFDQTRPYQQVPFQFSLHIQQEENGELGHKEYLALPHVDPRRELIEKLLDAIPDDACILTYNQTFEKGVLKDLANLFPDLSEKIEKVLQNIRDLMVPFRRRDVYRWQMRGSYSIKEVLPAMVPDLSYDEMEISDGTAAMQAYHEMSHVNSEHELARLRQQMLEYCKLDTFAMVEILKTLKRDVTSC